jgi:hypothetical protein
MFESGYFFSTDSNIAAPRREVGRLASRRGGGTSPVGRGYIGALFFYGTTSGLLKEGASRGEPQWFTMERSTLFSGICTSGKKLNSFLDIVKPLGSLVGFFGGSNIDARGVSAGWSGW